MRRIGIFIVFFFIVILIYFAFFFDNKLVVIKMDDNVDKVVSSNDHILNIPSKVKERKVLVEDGFHFLIGQPVTYVIQQYGDPERVDRSAYDYDWWIYSNAYKDGYFQVGVKNEKVVSIFVIGDNSLPTKPFQLGSNYEYLNAKFHFDEQVSFNIKNNSYQFNLTEEELHARPLLYFDGIFIQLYFDTFLNELSSIRYLDYETVIKHRPYSVVFRGELIEAEPLTEADWRKVEIGSSLQIFSITNEIRKKHSLQKLEWDDATASVAYYHSQDMSINDYFSHTSPTYGELKDRLKKEEILYMLAGENIAAKYVDAIEAVEGWLNSEGHRVNLLHEDFTHLGVGVYERYYTQNFITPW